MRVSLVANGIDSFFNAISNPWGLSLEERIAPLLGQAGYTVLAIESDSSYGLAILTNDIPYQLQVTVETRNLSPTVAATAAALHLAIQQATGREPLLIVPAGAGAPPPPETVFDRALDLPGRVVDNVETALTGTQAILIAVAIGAVLVVFVIASNPERGAKLFRG